MKNKIACSAERLDLLDPQMIQGVSDASAFHIGQQYSTENRVRIVEADQSQISSAVIGNSGLYEQTIRLKDGHLVSKCSCTLPEEPLCRHCIAVLLEYHRWAQPRQPHTAPPPPSTSSTKSSTNGSKTPIQPASSGRSSTASSAADVKLSEIMQFIEWLQPAMKAIEQDGPLPELPKLRTGEALTWVQMIKHLEDRRREAEDTLASQESDMRDREAYVGRLTQQLQTSMAEAKAMQAKSQELQRDVAAYKAMLSKTAELAEEIMRYDGQIRSVANDLLQKSSQLEKLAGSVHDVADTLKSATKPTPQAS